MSGRQRHPSKRERQLNRERREYHANGSHLNKQLQTTMNATNNNNQNPSNGMTNTQQAILRLTEHGLNLIATAGSSATPVATLQQQQHQHQAQQQYQYQQKKQQQQQQQQYQQQQPVPAGEIPAYALDPNEVGYPQHYDQQPHDQQPEYNQENGQYDQQYVQQYPQQYDQDYSQQQLGQHRHQQYDQYGASIQTYSPEQFSDADGYQPVHRRAYRIVGSHRLHPPSPGRHSSNRFARNSRQYNQDFRHGNGIKDKHRKRRSLENHGERRKVDSYRPSRRSHSEPPESFDVRHAGGPVRRNSRGYRTKTLDERINDMALRG